MSKSISERKTAAAYIRVSTDDQIEFSPDSQRKKIKDYAKKNGYILPEKFIFMDEGISGRKAAKRPAFNEMISLAKSGAKPFDIILVWKFSRFARNQEESIVYKSMLKKQCDVEVISISEPIIEGPFGDLIERIIEWSDEYYSINLAQEVRRGMTEKASRGGIVSVAAFGYKIENGIYVPNEQAPYVKMMFEDYVSGMGLRAIAVKYSNMGIKTRYGNTLDNRFVEYLLNNPVYIGKIRWSTTPNGASARHYDSNDIIIADGKHEPLISNELWEAAQKRLSDNKKMYKKYQRKEQTVNYMLKGLVRCSNCGATLCYSSLNDGNLQCHNYSRGSCHVSHSISVKKANAAVIDALKFSAATQQYNINQISAVSNSEDTSLIKKQLSEQRKRLERAKLAYTEGIDTIDEYRENKQNIQKTIKHLEAELDNQNAKPFNVKAYTEKAKNILNTVCDETASEELKNKLLRSIIKDIIYDKQSKSFIINYYI